MAGRRQTIRNGWNLLQFQIGWFALVLSVAAGRPMVGLTVLAVLVAIHLGFFARRHEWQFLAVVGLGGWIWETVVYRLGMLDFPGYSPGLMVAPVWMGALWLNFASTINHSLAWLKGRNGLASLFGAIGGPLAFLAGEKLGAVSLVYPLWSSALLTVGWSVLTPLVLWGGDKFGIYHSDVACSPPETEL